MTTYILSHPKIASVLVNPFSGRTSAWTFGINDKRTVSLFLGTAIGLALVIYITALFTSFNYGFLIQEREKTLQELQRLLIAEEVTAQKLHTNFGENHKDAPESFVDASVIRSH